MAVIVASSYEEQEGERESRSLRSSSNVMEKQGHPHGSHSNYHKQTSKAAQSKPSANWKQKLSATKQKMCKGEPIKHVN